jgi:type IV pilus assembly protein PilW
MVAARPTSSVKRQRGLTLIELMVSLVIGLLLVIAMSALFVTNSTSRRELTISADVIENGRYATDQLTRELTQAGFYGTLIAPINTAPLPLTPPAPCSVTLADWRGSLTYHAYGSNGGPGGATDTNLAGCFPAVARKPGTDAIWIQRVSTCFVGEMKAGVSICQAEDNKNAYLQVSECGDEFKALDPYPFKLEQGGTPASFPLQTNACDGTKGIKRKLIRRLFYITDADVLASVDIRLDGVQAPVALVDGIEQMQVEYAIDTSGDGTADVFTSTPTAVQWPQAVGARIWVLARSNDSSKNTQGAVKFDMGDLKGADAVSFPANAAGNPKRRIYSSYVSFTTPKARLEK